MAVRVWRPSGLTAALSRERQRKADAIDATLLNLYPGAVGIINAGITLPWAARFTPLPIEAAASFLGLYNCPINANCSRS